ncbi:MAG: DUF3127 domain-containing protein [Bacteroidota bacterium]
MELDGKIIEILPVQSGEGRNGTWKKQDFIVETQGQYPKKVCVSLWGDKIDNSILQPGAEIKASINIESREFNGRWYTDVKAWKLEPLSTQNSAAPSPGDFPPPPPEEDSFNAPSPSDDLPF